MNGPLEAVGMVECVPLLHQLEFMNLCTTILENYPQLG